MNLHFSKRTENAGATYSNCLQLLQFTNSAIMSLNRNQVAGHLGAANNPQFSTQTQHSSRVAIMQSAAIQNPGCSPQSVAGQIGVTTNPNASSAVQHSARQSKYQQ